MRKIIFAFAFAATLLSLRAEWESDKWLRLTDVSFEIYEDGENLDVSKGAHHGHWESALPVKNMGAARALESGGMCLRIEAQATNLTYVSERPGRTGGGNVLLFSVRTSAAANLEEMTLSSDSKGGFAVAPGDVAEGVSFYGWTDGGWCELKGTTVAPELGEKLYEVALCFRNRDGRVQVRYHVKAASGLYEVLTLPGGGDGWLNTSITDGNAAVGAVDFFGVGGLDTISSREKNGFSVRLR